MPDEPLILGDLPLQRVDAFKLVSWCLIISRHVMVSSCAGNLLKGKKLLGLLYQKFYGCSNTDTLIQLVCPHLEYVLLGLLIIWLDIQAIESVQICKQNGHS